MLSQLRKCYQKENWQLLLLLSGGQSTQLPRHRAVRPSRGGGYGLRRRLHGEQWRNPAHSKRLGSDASPGLSRLSRSRLLKPSLPSRRICE